MIANMKNPASLKTITLGGGCFWCLEAVYLRVQGVVAVESGYCNGHTLNPTYQQVCSGETGHNEVVKLTYDPAQIGLTELLEIFFVIHDPTSLNRQGNDVGTQYRSGIYYTDETDQKLAREVMAKAQTVAKRPIVTELLPLSNYSCAEAYHQNYFAQHPEQGYCAFVVAPKVQKFLNTFADRVKSN
jgi:peptide-methionine (S)-S-oxide reductase